MSLLIKHLYRFGEFTVDTDQKVLLRKDKPLPLAPKVFDTLLVLVENSGRLVPKEELMNRLWPDTFVEEANLTFNVQQLRKSLGDNARHPLYIETIARRGYRFVANVEEVLSERTAANDRIPRRLEPSDVQSSDPAHGLKSKAESQKPHSTIDLSSETKPSISAKNLAFISASDAASAGTRKRLAVLAVLIVILAGVGVALLKYLNGNKKAGDKSTAGLPLKLEKLTLTGQSRQAAISPDGKYIAYTRLIEKRQSIWLRQLAADIDSEIVPGSGRVLALAFSNSGEFLYFVRGDPTAIYRVPWLGGVPAKIIDRTDSNFSISPDDRQIAFVRTIISDDGQRQSSLMIAGSDGTLERTLLAGTRPDYPEVPIWSPDGQAIICSYGNSASGRENKTLIEVRVADGVQKELLRDRFYHIWKMAWLPNKTALILSGRKNPEGLNQLWRVSYPGMEVRQITEALSPFLDLSIPANADKIVATQATRFSDIWVGPSHDPRNLKKITQAIGRFCWTPNGRLIYSSYASGNGDVWIMQPDGTEQRQLTANARANYSPEVTPDNRYIIFGSNRTGGLYIWRMNIDGSNQIQLTDGATSDYPAISPDGRWVLYNTTDDFHLWRVAIDGGERTSLTDYPAYYPSVSPDGRMVVCVGRTEFKHEFSILVLRFEGGRPLKRFDFTGGSFSDFRIQWTPDSKALIYSTVRSGETAVGPIVIERLSLNGGPPEQLVEFEEGDLFDFGYSYDGKFLAVIRGGWQHDIVLIANLNQL